MKRKWLFGFAAAFVLGGTAVREAAAEAAEAAPREAIVSDWMHQDHGGDIRTCFTSSAAAEIESRMVARVLEEVGRAGRALAAEREKLIRQAVCGRDPRWRALYVRACEARRARRLRGLLARCRRIVFTKHYDLGGSHYAYTEGQSDAQAERTFRPGTALCMMEIEGLYARLHTLIADRRGVIRDPDVSYDGKRILFAWKKSDRRDDYHLYEMGVETRTVRQLTDGLGFADYEPAYLPNGDIVFNSTRCVQIVDCWWTEVSNLYTCDRDGKYLRRLSFDQVHTNFPTVLEDGRVIYTRWDYSDRGQVYPQPLFQMNADGTAQTECYGNNSWFPTTILHARGIPGTQRIMAVLSGHHCHQRGKLAVIDTSVGQQEATGVQFVAPVRETKAARVDAYGQNGEQFQYPYPVNERQFLVTYDRDSGGNRRYRRPYGVYFMDVDGRRELLAWDPKISCNQPVPLAPRRRPHARPSTVDYSKRTGVYYVRDVYAGGGLAGVPRGTVKRLRVVALEFRSVGIGSNRNGGPAGGALVSTPVAIDNGSWDVKKVLGSTPVHEDGSAMFVVPARTPVYFQLLDANNHAVQTMRTWSTLQPGETFSCVGCHEPKGEASAAEGEVAMAVRVGARKLDPFYGPPRGFSFAREIQPILDRHCIRCHNDRGRAPTFAPRRRKRGRRPGGLPPAPSDAIAPKKAFSLLDERTVDGRAKRRWSDSYLALTQRGRPNRIVNWLNAQSVPPMLPPYFAGAARSELIGMLAGGHNHVKLSREEMDKIACWIDLLVPFCGDYTEANAWNDREKAKYERYQSKRRRMEAVERENIRALLRRRGE